MKSPLPSAFLLLATLTTAAGAQQVDRYELGLRLRTFERHLGAATDPDRRRLALGELDRAVQAFFRLDTRAVAIAIAAAERALRQDDADPAQHVADSLHVTLQRRLVPTGGSVSATIDAAYPTTGDWPKDLRIELRLGGDGTQHTTALLPAVPVEATLPLSAAKAGDAQLVWSVHQGERELLRRTQGVSLADDLDGRLSRLDAAAKAAAELPPTLERQTLVLLERSVAGMTLRRPEETVLPGARLLADAESLAAAVAAEKPFFGPERTGQHWLRVPVEERSVTVRLLVPPQRAAAERQPLVVALHGAGGSENLFFDGYGDGAIVGLCEARGYYLCAPRLGAGELPLPELIDALAARWPIDAQRVLVVGHSMGAAQAIAAANRNPQRYRAIAALGGGGTITRGVELAKLPCFVGVGERDFALRQARALGKALRAAGAPTTEREYPDLEHLAIVQFALPDVFTFFDQALRPSTK